MKRIVPYVAVLALAGAAVTGCDKPRTGYNNSGASTTPAPTTPGAITTPTSADASSPNTTTTATTATTTPGGVNVVTDTVTTGKIKTAIASDSGLKDSDIVVTTQGGVVMLSGTAKSQDQVQIATNLAKSQEGVSRVETQIIVR